MPQLVGQALLRVGPTHTVLGLFFGLFMGFVHNPQGMSSPLSRFFLLLFTANYHVKQNAIFLLSD